MVQRLKLENWIAAGILVVACAAATLFAYRPQGRKLQAIQSQAALQQSDLAKDLERALFVPQMMREVKALKARYSGFDRRLPQRKELAGFLREITSIFASEELSNLSTEPGSPTREELYHTLPIIMKFQSSYLSLATLLERIDKMERLTRVQKLSIAKSGEKDDDLKIELRMNIYFKES